MVKLSYIRKLGRIAKIRKMVLWYRHLGLNPSDKFIASYPKSGTTWLRFMLGEIISKLDMNFDLLKDVMPEIESHRRFRNLYGIKLIKTHEKYASAYKKSVYLVRDVRDVAISYYHYLKREGQFEGSFAIFFNLFVLGKLDGYSSWTEHVQSWLEQKNKDPHSVKIVRYEDLLKNTYCVMKDITSYLEINCTDNDVEIAIRNNTADIMRAKEKVGVSINRNKRENIFFVRKATCNQWKSLFTDIDFEIYERELANTNSKFGYS